MIAGMVAAMKAWLMMAGILAAALPAIADTNLFDNGTWSLIGVEGMDPSAHKITVTVDKQAAGVYSDLLLQFNFTGLGPAPTCEISGEGPMRMLLPPPSVPGGHFELASYWDCATGLVRAVAITELSFQTKGNAKSPLKVTGKLSNFDSLEATKLTMQFSPPATNRAQVDLKYQLRATRDLCVDLSGHDNQDEFRTVTMRANYLSAESNQNDVVRYIHVTNKSCDPWSGCHVSRKSLCASLLDETNYLFNSADRISDQTLALFHTTTLPANTPSLKVDFRSPSSSTLKPQAFIAPVADDVTENVLVWGNWLNVKKEYRRGRSLRNFRVILYVRAPVDPPCDQTK
jgi:hypothetical protein